MIRGLPGFGKRPSFYVGVYHSPGWNRDYPAIQIVTVRGLLDGTQSVKLPPSNVTFKQAGKVRQEDGPPQIGFDGEG